MRVQADRMLNNNARDLAGRIALFVLDKYKFKTFGQILDEVSNLDKRVKSVNAYEQQTRDAIDYLVGEGIVWVHKVKEQGSKSDVELYMLSTYGIAYRDSILDAAIAIEKKLQT